MKGISKLLGQLNNNLDAKLTELDKLELEKREIIERYQFANMVERQLLQVHIRKSIRKFQKLSSEVIAMSEQVKQLKKMYQ